MDEESRLTERFEESRPHLLAVAYRMLGSASEAEDAVQETWLRLDRTDTSEVANLRGWLTTVVSRVCLDMLRARKTRGDDSIEQDSGGGAAVRSRAVDPEEEAVLARSVGLALLVVLETLSPPERVAFVLHDLFDLDFKDIAAILDKSEDAARQLASRARRRVRGGDAPVPADVTRQYALVDAFLAASRGGDFETLLTMLHPDVVFRADSAAMRGGPARQVRGAQAVAGFYRGRAQGAGAAILDGRPGIVVAPLGQLMMVIRLEFDGDVIAAIDVTAEPEALRALEIAAMG